MRAACFKPLYQKRPAKATPLTLLKGALQIQH
jgi:hypothetical protein